MKTLLTFALLLIAATTFGQKKPEYWIQSDGYWYKRIFEVDTEHPNHKQWTGHLVKGAKGVKISPDGVIYLNETKHLEKHYDGRWFEIKKDPRILASLPPQQDVDTIFYELKETGRKSGRITLNK